MLRYRSLILIATLPVVFSACNRMSSVQFKPKAGSVRSADVSVAFTMGPQTTLTDLSLDLATDSVASNGTVTLKATITGYKQETPGMEDMFENAPPQLKQQMGDDPFGQKARKKAFDSLKGSSFTVEVNKSGKLQSVSGADALASKVESDIKATAGPVGEFVAMQVKQEIGDDAMKELLKSVFPAAPTIPTKIGESRQSQNVLHVGMMPITEDFTLTTRAAAGTSLEADVKTNYSIDAKKLVEEIDKQIQELKKKLGNLPVPAGGENFIEEMKNELAKNKPTLSGDGTGTITFDTATGWVIDSSVAGRTSGEFESTFKTTVKTYPK